MREILFRGKPDRYSYMDDEEIPKWIFGDGIYVYWDSYNQEDVVQVVDTDERRVQPIYAQTAGQYTGLKDKNGVKIFDGDICTDGTRTVKVCWYAHGWHCKVMKGEEFRVGIAFPLWHWDGYGEDKYGELEIIGNIHDNPELIEK